MPTQPSTASLLTFWKLRTDLSVSLPNIPSAFTPTLRCTIFVRLRFVYGKPLFAYGNFSYALALCAPYAVGAVFREFKAVRNSSGLPFLNGGVFIARLRCGFRFRCGLRLLGGEYAVIHYIHIHIAASAVVCALLRCAAIYRRGG